MYLLWPTIRPDMFNTCFQYWKSSADNPNLFKTKVIVNTQEQANDIIHKDLDISISTSQVKGITASLYELTSKLDCQSNDIIIVASDDFYPPTHWDTIIKEQFIDFDGAVIFWDGNQRDTPMVTLPIMTFNTLKRLNRKIYHPDYKHQFSDVELYFNLNEMGLIKDLRIARNDILFEHRHYHLGKRKMDSVDQYIESVWSEDRVTIDRRMKLSLAERLI
jgi:hypothetical protein